MDKIIEQSKKAIETSRTLARLELEKQKIELEARAKLFGESLGLLYRRNCSSS